MGAVMYSASYWVEPDWARRYKKKTQVERFFSRIKDEFGGRLIYVRGSRKVWCI